MDTRRMAQFDVSVVGLGCNNFGTRIDVDQTAEVVTAAVDAGITHFDTADLYGDGLSEEFLGQALVGLRDDVVIATKFGMRQPPENFSGPRLTGGDPRWVRQAVDESLRRLATDRIDHYILHQPDPTIGIEETLEALHEQVAKGKVLSIGCSNFSATQLDEAADAADSLNLTAFSTVQNRYSVLHREPEPEVLPWCADHATGMVPFFPLESGLLTGKVGADGKPPPGTRLDLMPAERVANFLNDDRVDVVQRLTEFARTLDRTILELAFGYLLAQPEVPSVIAGASTPDQVRANVAAAGWHLTPDEVGEIRDIVAGAAPANED